VFLLLFALIAATVAARDLQAPVSSKEKSAREWEKSAERQLEDEAEHEAVMKMGGKASAIVNVLIGDVNDGVVHPVGNKEYGIQSSNFTKVAKEFLVSIGRGADMDDLEKVEYWLYQGAGLLCDSCKVLVEEMQRTVLAVSSKKIQGGETQDKKFKGGAGHQVVMDDQVKEAIRSVWRNPGYYEVNQFMREWAKDTIAGQHSNAIMSTLTQGAFSLDELDKRKQLVCGRLLHVCPIKAPAPTSEKMSTCRACTEGMQDLQHMLLRDRHDLEIGKWDRKKQTGKGKVYCSRTHVFYRAQALTEKLPQYHPASSLSKITEVTEQILEEHESEIVSAFVDGCKDSIGSAGRAVCTDIAEVCDNDEYDEALLASSAYHVPQGFPRTHGLDLDYSKTRAPEHQHEETEL
jgi:hypothetical protein